MSGEEIKLARELLGMTQAELAKRLDTHIMTISKWERGERKPSGAAAMAIKLLFNTGVN
jgi:putative transcriptional regulator